MTAMDSLLARGFANGFLGHGGADVVVKRLATTLVKREARRDHLGPLTEPASLELRGRVHRGASGAVRGSARTEPRRPLE